MSQTSSSENPGLQLHEFKWERTPSEVRVAFYKGLNILHGKTQAERTILLRLVRYALGGSSERIDEAIMKSSNNVELKFSANGESIRVVRNCQHPSAQFEIYELQGKRMLTPSEMSGFLIEKLALPKIYLPMTRADGSRSENLLSFGDLARAFVIDRDVSYAGIMAGAFDRNISETVKVMLGLTTREVAEIENRARNLESRLNDLRQSIQSVRNFLKTLDVPSLIEIESRRQNLQEALERLKEEETNLHSATRQQIAENTSTSLETTYEMLRDEMLSKRHELDDDRRDLLNLSYQKREKAEVRALLAAEADRIERLVSSKYVISTFLFSQCPRCRQTITHDMTKREADGHCMLCDRTFSEAEDQSTAWEKALRDTRQMIKEVTTLVDDYEAREADLRKSIVQLGARIVHLESELARESAQYVAPILERINLISLQKIALERALSQLDYEQRERELAIRYEEQDLPEAQSELERVQTELVQLRAKVGTTSDHYNAFLVHFRRFLESVNLDQRVETVSWDDRTQLPLINGQSYKIMIGFDMAVTVLAFHFALLAMGVRPPSVRTGHPKILIVDEPEQQKMGKERYQQILNLFAQLGLENENTVQIILATEGKDVPAPLDSHAYEI